MLLPLFLQPHGIAPTLIIVFVVAGGGFYSYYIHQGNKLDIERKIVRKKLSFMHTKRYDTFFAIWMQSRVGTIQRLLQILSTDNNRNSFHTFFV